ncbi:MmyB family transcriptional regulator [Nocardia fusca]|uniref:MmyB-like transcription regulator ligand binding domain-containing protein n=1 Tax=Nocardia fusca TaxID=941183 RepID=A0ABV3F4B0_9NOCA
MKSPEFVALWSDHRVKPCEADAYELRHPLVGMLTVTQQNLTPARSPDQWVIAITTAAGSSSATTLELLAQSIHMSDDSTENRSSGREASRLPVTAE